MKIGDRVICVRTYGPIEIGMKGTIVQLPTPIAGVGIFWDKESTRFHTCSENCPNKHGYYVGETNITVEKIDNWKTRIQGDKNE